VLRSAAGYEVDSTAWCGSCHHLDDAWIRDPFESAFRRFL